MILNTRNAYFVRVDKMTTGIQRFCGFVTIIPSCKDDWPSDDKLNKGVSPKPPFGKLSEKDLILSVKPCSPSEEGSCRPSDECSKW